MTFALTVALSANARAESAAPIAVSPGTVVVETGVRVRDVALGRRICVLGDAGRVRCGSMVTPFEDVPLPGPVTAVTAGLGGACAQLASGETACWDCPVTGPPNLPQPKTTTGPLLLPFPVLKNLTVGWTVACGVLETGAVQCWGDLKWSSGQAPSFNGALICHPSAFDQMVPKRFITTETLPQAVRATRVALPPDVTSFKSLAVDWAADAREYERAHGSGRTQADVDNLLRSLADETPAQRARESAALQGSPGADTVWVLGVDGHLRHKGVKIAKVSHAIDVQVSGTLEPDEFDKTGTGRPARGCALLADGRIACWGSNRFGQSQATVRFPSPAKQLALGPDHACVLVADGRVFCWGANPRSALGFASDAVCPAHCRYASCATTPRPVEGLDHVTRVRAGPDFPPFSCAVTESGQLACWGHGYGLKLPGTPIVPPVSIGARQCEPEMHGL